MPIRMTVTIAIEGQEPLVHTGLADDADAAADVAHSVIAQLEDLDRLPEPHVVPETQRHCMNTPPPNLRAVLALLLARGIPATYESTGGGCGTLYAGSSYAGPGGPYYPCTVGPSVFVTGAMPACDDEGFVCSDEDRQARPTDHAIPTSRLTNTEVVAAVIAHLAWRATGA